MKYSAPDDVSGGPAIFLRRLTAALTRRGHTRVETAAAQDLRLALAADEIGYWQSRNIPVLLRMDGIHHRNDQFFGLQNRRLAESHAQADGIVYQSLFAQTMCMKYLGLPTTPITRVIPNGCVPPDPTLDVPSPYPEKDIVLAVAEWRPHKRLEDTIRGFLAWDNPRAILCVAGTGTLPVTTDRVVALGRLSENELSPFYRHALALIHICWIDWCPNAVVEALAHGVPVICASNGGTPELVQRDGIVIEDLPYNLEPCDLYHPPPVAPERVAAALRQLKESPPRVNRPDLDIAHIAEEYETIMRQTLRERPCLQRRAAEIQPGSPLLGRGVLTGLFAEAYVKSRVRSFHDRHGPLLLYGAGRHTQWLLRLCGAADFAGIVDDDPTLQGTVVDGLTIMGSNDDRLPPFAAVLISSDARQDELLEKARRAFPPSTPVLRLYPEHFPPGPYPKL